MSFHGSVCFVLRKRREYVNDDSIQSGYKQMGKEVIYQHIVLAKPKQSSRKSIDS